MCYVTILLAWVALAAAQEVDLQPSPKPPTVRVPVHVVIPGTGLAARDQKAVDEYMAKYHDGLSRENEEFLRYAIPLMINARIIDARDEHGAIVLDHRPDHYFALAQPYIEGFLNSKMYVDVPAAKPLPPYNPRIVTGPVIPPLELARVSSIPVLAFDPVVVTSPIKIETLPKLVVPMPLCIAPPPPPCAGVTNPGIRLPSSSGSSYGYTLGGGGLWTSPTRWCSPLGPKAPATCAPPYPGWTGPADVNPGALR